MDNEPRLYGDLAWLWPFVSPPESYPGEVEAFSRRLADAGVKAGATILHLGSGGGSVDHHLQRTLRSPVSIAAEPCWRRRRP